MASQNPEGRPSLYKPEYCQLVLSMGDEGKTVVQMAVAIDVTRSTIYEWAETHPEFSDALTRARNRSQAWWEAAGQGGLVNKEFNGNLYNKIVASRFREDYGDRQAIEHTGKDGGPIQTETAVRPAMTREEWLATYVDASARTPASGD